MIILIADDEIYMVEYIKTLVEWEHYGFDQILTAAGGSMTRVSWTACESSSSVFIKDI